MPSVDYSSCLHAETMGGVHPEPEPGTPSSARDPASSSHPDPTASIIPGGGAFALPSSSVTFRSQPRNAPSTTIYLKGEPNVAYQVNDSNSTLPQWATATDSLTGAPLSSGIEVQKNNEGQWEPVKDAQVNVSGTPGIKLTPVKLPDDPIDYVIKNPSNITTPQPLFTQAPDGSLRQTPKQGIYDGDRGVKPVCGLPGGLDPSKDALRNRIDKANARLAEAQRKAGEAHVELTRLQRTVTEAGAATTNANSRFVAAQNAYVTARGDWVRFRDSQDRTPTVEAQKELERLKAVENEKATSALTAQKELETARGTYSQAVRNANTAEENLRDRLREVDSADKELSDAMKSSS